MNVVWICFLKVFFIWFMMGIRWLENGYWKFENMIMLIGVFLGFLFGWLFMVNCVFVGVSVCWMCFLVIKFMYNELCGVFVLICFLVLVSFFLISFFSLFKLCVLIIFLLLMKMLGVLIVFICVVVFWLD